MKTLVNITENNRVEIILKAVQYVYVGHGADGFMKDNCTLTLERDGEEVKYITGLRWKDYTLLEPEKNNTSNILLAYINNVEDIPSFNRLYTDLLITDKIYLNTP